MLYFLGHTFPYSSFGGYKDRCYNLVDMVVDIGVHWYMSLSRWRFWGGDDGRWCLSADQVVY